jgi:hypothetical protein
MLSAPLVSVSVLRGFQPGLASRIRLILETKTKSSEKYINQVHLTDS